MSRTASIFTKLRSFIEGVLKKLITYKEVEQVANFESPLSPEMEDALNEWALMYQNKAEWLAQPGVYSMGLPAFISAEIARQVVLEVKWNITAKTEDGAEPPEDGSDPENDRSKYLKQEFEKCMRALREKLEVGTAAGSMVIKPYPRDDHLFFEYVMAWSMYPIAFNGAGELTDVIFKDTYTIGKTTYTRLERHKLENRKRRNIDGAEGESGDKTETVAVITQRCFKSQMRDQIGTECSLKEVPVWADLQPEAILRNTGGKLLVGWYKVASANSVDLDSPLGVSVYAKARDLIRDADKQYSRLLWEFEGGELAIDVDPLALRQKQGTGGDGSVHYEQPQLNQRLFRGVDNGRDETYHVFSPPLRDGSLLNGLNRILSSIEDCCGLARGTISDPTNEAMTATQLKILRKRTYDTITGNQQALEDALRDVVHAMDVHVTLANLAPEGEWELSFEWDDSIIVDTDQQLNERLALLNSGIISREELRSWYLGETDAQAQAAIAQIDQARMEQMMKQTMLEGGLGMPQELAGEPQSEPSEQ